MKGVFITAEFKLIYNCDDVMVWLDIDSTTSKQQIILFLHPSIKSRESFYYPFIFQDIPVTFYDRFKTT